jgi:hypothetical protein
VVEAGALTRRGFLVLVGLLAVVGILIVWTRTGTRDGGNPSGPGERRLFDLEKHAVMWFALEAPSGAIRLERSGASAWTIVSPYVAEADPRRVGVLLDGVRDVPVVREVEAEADAAERFGLDAPTFRLDIGAGEGKTVTVRVGARSPVGEERYAVVDGGPVLLVDRSIADALNVTAEEMRERRLVPVDADELVGISLIDGAGHRVALEKDGDAWWVIDPVRDAAAPARVASLLRNLTSLRLVRLDEPQEDPGAARRSRLGLRIRTANETWDVSFGGLNTAGEVRAWREDSSVSGTVPRWTVDELSADPDRYRERRMVFASIPDVLAVTLESGRDTTHLKRVEPGAPWLRSPSGQPGDAADPDEVRRFLDVFRMLTATGIEPAGTRLPSPALSVELGGRGTARGRVEIAEGKVPGESRMVLATSTWREGVVFRIADEDRQRLQRLARALGLEGEAR